MSNLKEQRVLAGVDSWDREEARKPIEEFGMGGGPMHGPDPKEERFKDEYMRLYGDLLQLHQQLGHLGSKAKAIHYLEQALKLLDKGLWHVDD